jgi:hypothetical protein
MTASNTELPAIFALQTERNSVVPNSWVASYEKQLGAELGVPPGDVHLGTSGTTTTAGDSQEDD